MLESPPGSLFPSVPSLLGRTIRRCLAKDPSRRYQAALDIRNEFEELKQDVQSGDLAGGAGLPTVERARWPKSLWLAGVAALVVIAWMSGLASAFPPTTTGPDSPPLLSPAAESRRNPACNSSASDEWQR